MDGKRLFTEAAALLRDETRLAAMHEASLRLGVRDATERIYETVMALVKLKPAAQAAGSEHIHLSVKSIHTGLWSE